MTKQSVDVWDSRDLPVLRHVVQRLDAEVGGLVTVDDAAAALGMTMDDVTRAGLNLKRNGLVEVMEFEEAPFHGFTEYSGRALREVGMWPTAETALDRMIAALQAIAENTDAPEDERSRARKILDSVSGAGRQMAISVAAAAITGQIPT